MIRRERFAPSPTGPLHIGHAFSAITAHDAARAAGGRFDIRIEDIDPERSKPQWEAQIFDDLAWLGLEWDAVVRQSDRMAAYAEALDRLWHRDLLYHCTCSRRDIADALSAPQEGAPLGPDGVIYPGTCRARGTRSDGGRVARPRDAALRLDLAAVRAALGDTPLTFQETGGVAAPAPTTVRTTLTGMMETVGDVVLSRRGWNASYHLSVVVDDADGGYTHITRGADLFDATVIHVTLQKLLGYDTPVYVHHRLIRDADGKRLAKRDDARAIAAYRADGLTPSDIRARVGLQPAGDVSSTSRPSRTSV